MKYDVIIIGAGLGGLTSGAVLAKKGKKVLMLEQHNIPGGCATTFKHRDYKVEVGLHMIDGLDSGDPKRKLFEDLGVLDNMEFIRIPEFYSLITPGGEIVIPDDMEKAKQLLCSKYPEESEGVVEYFRIISVLRKEGNYLPRNKWKLLMSLPVLPFRMSNLLKDEKTSVGDLMDRLFCNEELKLTLLANLGFYTDDPYKMSLVYFSSGQASYMGGGAYFIKGGSQVLSDYLASIIMENGGEIRYKSLVDEIVIENGKAVGIKYKSKKQGKEYSETIYGKQIIANAAIPTVMDSLIKDNHISQMLREKIGKREVAPAILSMYLGYKKPLRELGFNRYTTFFFNGNVGIKELNNIYYSDYSVRPLLFTDYSQIDSGLAPGGKGLGTVCLLDRIEDWQDLEREEYKKKKEEVAKLLIDRLDKYIPGIKSEIDYRNGES